MRRKAKGIDWEDVKRRLDESQRALEKALAHDPQRSEAIYRDRALRLADRREGFAGPGQGLNVLVFGLGPERYCVELSCLTELLPYAGCTPVPGGGPALLGVLNVRGAILSVVDLGLLLRLTRPQARNTGYLLLLRRDEGEAAVCVDEVERATVLSPADLVAPPAQTPGAPDSLVRGLAPGQISLLNVAALLDHAVWKGPTG